MRKNAEKKVQCLLDLYLETAAPLSTGVIWPKPFVVSKSRCCLITAKGTASPAMS